MYILCDTCSVLMLLRIAPEMFIDGRFGCATISEVRRELFQTQKFKTKYSWRTHFKSKIKVLKASELEDDNYEMFFSAIRNLHENGLINSRTGKLFGLSYVDQKIAAYAATYNYVLNSTDDDLCDFVEQEFEKETITPLGIVNEWLENGFVIWDENLQEIIEDWDRCNEHPQPGKEVKRFEKLTGYRYLGPQKR